MASIRDALEESVIEGTVAYIKYFLVGGLIFYCLTLYLNHNLGGLFLFIAFLTLVVILGFSLITTSNVKNGHNKVLPSFNVFKLLWIGLKGLVAIGPIILVNMFLAKITSGFLVGLFANYGVSSNFAVLTIKICTCLIYSSFIMTAYLLYSNRFNFTDAYNIKLITKYCMDIIFGIIMFIPKIIIVDGIIVGFGTYILWLLFGIPSPICNFFWSVAFAWNLGMGADYLAQVNYEIIDFHENKNTTILD